METINGVWYMKGCRRSDRGCLHSPDDLLELVREVGFLPLFSNDIPGFSVEEHTPAADWWTDDPARDPWAWRQVLAPNEQVAYGKFFDKKAGFVSREWFPAFANYRRDGYDYEGLYEDGKMTSRCKRIMDVLGLNEDAEGTALLSCDLRKRAALEKGFEGAVTDLQMKSFLIVSDFRQKRNRRGGILRMARGGDHDPRNQMGIRRGKQPSREAGRLLETHLQPHPEAFPLRG